MATDDAARYVVLEILDKKRRQLEKNGRVALDGITADAIIAALRAAGHLRTPGTTNIGAAQAPAEPAPAAPDDDEKEETDALPAAG